MKRAHLFGAYLAILLGLAHLSVTFANYRALTLDALWFASAGVALLLAGFLNLGLNRSGGVDRVLGGLCILANAILTLMFVIALRLIQEPQAFVGAGLFVFLTATSILIGKSPGRAAG
jgi:hypothetical protein